MNSILHCCTALIYTSERTLNSVSQFANISSRRGDLWLAHAAWRLQNCIFYVYVHQQHSCHFYQPNLFMNKHQNSGKEKKKKKGWLHRVTGNRYETKLSQTWPNNKAETLCRQRLGWSELFIGSLWGLLTDTHICVTHKAIIKELAVSMKTDKEVNILYIITSKTWLIALKNRERNPVAITGRGETGLSSWLLLW